MVDALTGDVLATNTLEKPRAAVFDLQDALAKEVSQILRKGLGNEVESAVNRPGTSNAEAGKRCNTRRVRSTASIRFWRWVVSSRRSIA